jgi:RNA polymerase sigma-70 factor, ECF subfamily
VDEAVRRAADAQLIEWREASPARPARPTTDPPSPAFREQADLKYGTFRPRPGNTYRVGDEGLLDRAKKGDADAVSRLFARYQGPIYRYAAHMCGRDAGDDIVQETFLTVMRQPGRYDPTRGPVVGYLFGIARNLALKRLTSRGAAAFFDELDEDDRTADPAQETALESLIRKETIEAVRAAVGSLPPLYREVVVLCELQEMDYAAAAGIIQCPIGTVRSRLHRARTLLTAKLAAMGPTGGMKIRGDRT